MGQIENEYDSGNCIKYKMDKTLFKRQTFISHKKIKPNDLITTSITF